VGLDHAVQWVPPGWLWLIQDTAAGRCLAHLRPVHPAGGARCADVEDALADSPGALLSLAAARGRRRDRLRPEPHVPSRPE